MAETCVVGISEPTCDALQNIGEMLFDDLVVDTASPLLALKEPAPAHEQEMLGSHVTGDPARCGELPHGVLTL
jgi:hypothetical protein